MTRLSGREDPMHNLIVCDDFVADPLAQAAGELAGSNAPRPVKLSEFLQLQGFGFDAMTGQMQRQHRPAGDWQARILDRVIEVSRKTVEMFDGGKGVLERGQIYACYEDALREHAAGSGAARQYSTVGRLVPLPTQWHLIQQAGLGVSVPDYLYGYGPTPVDASGFTRPVFKSPFDLYHWRPDEAEPGDIWDQFVVESPQGAAVLVYFLGQRYCVAALRDGEKAIARDQASTLIALSQRVAQTFSAEIGEVLWYVSGDEIVFAAFSHFLNGAPRTDQFPARARDYLSEYFTG